MRRLLAVRRYEFYSNVKSYQIVLNRETFGSPLSNFLHFLQLLHSLSLSGEKEASQRQCKRCVDFLLRIPDEGNQNRRFLVQQRMLKDRIIWRQTAREGQGGRGRRTRRRKGGGSSSGIFALPSEWGGGAVQRYFSLEKFRNNVLSRVNLNILNGGSTGPNFFLPQAGLPHLPSYRALAGPQAAIGHHSN